MTERDVPSPLLQRHAARLEAAAKLGPVVDLACGRGRHAIALAERGTPVLAIDRNPAFLRELADAAARRALPITPVRSDLESAPSPPLAAGRCGALLVFRYLHRPLVPALVEALHPGGLLLYETFTHHQRDLGYGPSNPAFLLEDGELPRLFSELEVIEAWEGTTEGARPAALARLVARRPL